MGDEGTEAAPEKRAPARGTGKSQFGYERELKAILMGDEKVIRKVTANVCVQKEYLKIQKQPFLVTRAAASLGVDLVAMNGSLSFPVEVKASKEETIGIQGRLKAQAGEYFQKCVTYKLLPIYAYRLKNAGDDPWRLFCLLMPDGSLTGKLKLLYERIPTPERTKKGNLILRWEKGMRLSDFIEYIIEVYSEE